MALGQPIYASVPAEVGSAQMIRGTVTAQLQEQDARTLEKTSPIFETDMIKTGAKSFAVIKLKDGTRITVRPDSELGIKKYKFEEGKEEAEFELVKGGMRALTGLMGKSSPDATKVKTAYATMGIRGTSFDVRLCDADCVAEQQQKSGTRELTSLVVGRAVNLNGTVKVVDADGESRIISEGGPVYTGDRVIAEKGASTLLVFRDDTRLALMSGSELVLNDYAFETEQGNKFDARLIRGDVQVKSGKIADSGPDAFSVQTKTSKIGPEGTTFTTADGNVDLQELFSAKTHDFATPGAYVTVYKGHVKLSRPPAMLASTKRWMVASLGMISGLELLAQTYEPEYIDLGAGESAFANDETMYRMLDVPLFQTEDCIPHPEDLEDQSIWPPVYFKGDSCASFYASYTGSNSPSIEGGAIFDPGVELPTSPDETVSGEI